MICEKNGGILIVLFVLFLEWFIADGPVLLSELSKLLKYDGRKKEEIKKK